MGWRSIGEVPGQTALEHEVNLMSIRILVAEFVIGANILPDVAQWPDHDADAQLLQALSLKGVRECLARLLPSPGKREPITLLVTMDDRQERLIADDDGLTGVAHGIHVRPHIARGLAASRSFTRPEALLLSG
jgi:hypothetical protein